jgi:hypothetical protein
MVGMVLVLVLVAVGALACVVMFEVPVTPVGGLLKPPEGPFDIAAEVTVNVVVALLSALRQTADTVWVPRAAPGGTVVFTVPSALAAD